MRTGLLVILIVGWLARPAEASHIAGHYGGGPMVQPAPLPWRPAPAPPVQPYVPPPVYIQPQQPIYVPVPVPVPAAPIDESPSIPARRRAPNLCGSGCE